MRRVLTLLAASAAVLAGCGGDDDGGGAPVTVPGDEPVEVTATEYEFEPARIVVQKPTGPVKIELTNQGAVAHDLKVRGEDGEDIGGTPVFGPDQTEGTSVELDPGTYEFYCSVSNHEDLGMKGTLEVE